MAPSQLPNTSDDTPSAAEHLRRRLTSIPARSPLLKTLPEDLSRSACSVEPDLTETNPMTQMNPNDGLELSLNHVDPNLVILNPH